MEGQPFERRRYSAVLLTHPSLKSINDVSACTEGQLSKSLSKITGIRGWSVARSEWLATRSHYPSHVVPAESRSRENGYAHDFYVAIRRPVSKNEAPLVLVASPYVRLLGSFLRKLGSQLRPGARFAALDLEAATNVFSSMPSTSPFRVRRVTLQILSEVGRLELVSLAGRNPLHSDLIGLVTSNDVTRPYSFGVEVDRGNDSMRVNFDRHGNFWWYLSSESDLQGALRMVDEVIVDGLTIETRSLPLTKSDPEEAA